MKSGNPSSRTPLVSIITPAYNVEPYLAETLTSVIHQTYPNWELLLVVDSGSRDKTLDVARQFAQQDSRIHVIYDELSHPGVSNNRNRAIEAAQGEVMAFLDSDDLWLPNKLMQQVAHLHRTNAVVSYHSFTPFHQGRMGKTRAAKKVVTAQDLMKDNVLSCISVMAHSSLIKHHHFKNVPHEDLVFWLEILNGREAQPLAENLALYRVRSDSRSGNKIRSAYWRWNLYRQQGLSFFSSVGYMAAYIFNSIAKRI